MSGDVNAAAETGEVIEKLRGEYETLQLVSYTGGNADLTMDDVREIRALLLLAGQSVAALVAEVESRGKTIADLHSRTVSLVAEVESLRAERSTAFEEHIAELNALDERANQQIMQLRAERDAARQLDNMSRGRCEILKQKNGELSDERDALRLREQRLQEALQVAMGAAWALYVATRDDRAKAIHHDLRAALTATDPPEET